MQKGFFMLYLSKSKYCKFCQCPKIIWLQKHKPEEEYFDPQSKSLMEKGNEIGDLAMGLWGSFVEVTAYKDGKLDLSEMSRRTAIEMAKETPVICEASFMNKGLYCAVDILKRSSDCWELYEVKSSATKDGIKQTYLADIAYQRYVLEQCGVHISATYLVTVNTNYVFDGNNLDLSQLFDIRDVSADITDELSKIPQNLKAAEAVMQLETEPDIDISRHCNDPYRCPFWQYCTRDLPDQSVFNLYRFKDKFDCYQQGIVSFEDYRRYYKKKNPIRDRQVEYALEDKGTYVDRKGIAEFLSTLSYPLFFLDFETMQPAVPRYAMSKPYAQIPFQYSLHYIEEKGGPLMHREFLAESGPDPRRPLAEKLCDDIPPDVCVLAYNKSFECNRLKELAELFPDLAEHLLSIENNILDLLTPFRNGYYYNRAMGGSFSIKSVLPAMFPEDPELDYKNLEGVHNGSEAMEVFPLIKDMDERECEETRRNLLRYCALDTYAIVRIWEKLEEAAAM